MRFTLKSPVKADFKHVVDNFGLELFELITPPSFMAELDLYEGSYPGDRIILNFKLPPGKWVSVIESRKETENEFSFTDNGVELPFPIKSWHHDHKVLKRGAEVVIVDEITFTSRYWLLAPILYASMVLSFMPRKKAYRKFFEI